MFIISCEANDFLNSPFAKPITVHVHYIIEFTQIVKPQIVQLSIDNISNLICFFQQ